MTKYLSRSLCVALAAVFLLNGCVVGYRKYPRHQLNTPAPGNREGRLLYQITGFAVGGGAYGLREVFKNQSPFAGAEERSEIPDEGVFVKASIKGINPSVPSFIFGYLSYATLTLTPSWSTKDGYIVTFEIYRDGTVTKSFDYETRRFIGVWLFLLPLIWVNLLTASEHDVFQAIAKQFFEDSRTYLE